MTTNYAAAAAVVDRLLTEHGIDQDDVLSVDLHYLYGKEVGYKKTLVARAHIDRPIDGFDYSSTPETPRYMEATLAREELPITLVWVAPQEAAA